MIDPNTSFGDFGQVEDDNGFTPLPRAIYKLRITQPEIKPTTTGGQRVTCRLQVAEGQYEGRTIFESFNVVNSNPKAVQIALKQIKSMFKSAGIDTSGQVSWGLIQSAEGAICSALVGLDKQNPEYNAISRFIVEESAPIPAQHQINQNQPTQQQTAQTAQYQQTNQNVTPQNGHMPWQNR